MAAASDLETHEMSAEIGVASAAVHFKGGPSQYIKSAIKRSMDSIDFPGTPQSVKSVARKWLHSTYMDVLSGLVVCIDLGLACVDIDLRAAGAPGPTWAFLVCQGCLAFYMIELFWHAFVGGWRVLRSFNWWIDASIVIASITEVVFLFLGSSAEEVRVVKLLRIARITRLIRFVRKSPSLRELRKLMMMFASVIRTLGWSFLFCFIATTLWSMVAVELVNPIVQQLADEGEFSDCKECREAFSSILQSNLTFLQTMLAGDSWGSIAMPVIRRQPYTAIIFVGALVSVVYGILNLVVAVIVDAAMEQREKDITTLAADLDYELEEDLKRLAAMFKTVDANGDGELSLQELLRGAEQVPEFQNRLRVMDIDAVDLEQLFRMLDEDQGGSISPDEFTLTLSRWMRESKTAHHFVKYMVRNLSVTQSQMQKQMKSMNKNIEKLAKGLKAPPAPAAGSGSGIMFKENSYGSEASAQSQGSGASGASGTSAASGLSDPKVEGIAAANVTSAAVDAGEETAPRRAMKFAPSPILPIDGTREFSDRSSSRSTRITAVFDESLRELDGLVELLRKQLEDVRGSFLASLSQSEESQELPLPSAFATRPGEDMSHSSPREVEGLVRRLYDLPDKNDDQGPSLAAKERRRREAEQAVNL